VTSPIKAITTPAISSLRSRERLFQKEDTGNWLTLGCFAFCLELDFLEEVFDLVREDLARLLRLPVPLLGEDPRLDLERDDFRAEALDVFFCAIEYLLLCGTVYGKIDTIKCTTLGILAEYNLVIFKTWMSGTDFHQYNSVFHQLDYSTNGLKSTLWQTQVL
jgi:hypothetical protein